MLNGNTLFVMSDHFSREISAFLECFILFTWFPLSFSCTDYQATPCEEQDFYSCPSVKVRPETVAVDNEMQALAFRVNTLLREKVLRHAYLHQPRII